jgi:hypothetical protein
VAAETNESGFVIDGVVYEVPGLDTLTMDEAQVLYDYSGLGLEDFAQSADETEEETKARERLFRNPGLMRALMHIAYQRKHTKLPSSQIRRLVGAANVLDALQGLTTAEPEADEIPLASTSEPNKPSSSGSLENDSSTPPSNETGGNGSPNGSDVQAGLPRATTTTRSATSSISARESSAA